jgi:hypothetical protein
VSLHIDLQEDDVLETHVVEAHRRDVDRPAAVGQALERRASLGAPPAGRERCAPCGP